MASFILMLHDDPATIAAMSPDEMQSIVADYMAWSDRMAAAGVLRGGEKLKDEGGRRLTAREGKLVATDGPYAEAKDVIGGFFIIAAADYAEAERLITDCPHLRYGEIELREIEPMEEEGAA